MDKQQNKIIYFLMTFLCFIFYSCQKMGTRVMHEKEYKKYINSEQSVLQNEKEINRIKYTVRLQPAEYLTLCNMSGNEKNDSVFKSEMIYYKDKMNVIMLISDGEESEHIVKRNIFDASNYSSIMSYANSQMANDFMLVQDEDTLYTSFIHLEPANSIQPLLRLSLNFRGINPDAKEYTIIYHDHIFNGGPMKFRYSREVFKNLPELKM